MVLLFFSYQVREDVFSRDLWLPVALVGTFLLNPRIMKYDMAALTIPMLLIAWRGLRAVFQNDSDSAASSSRVLLLVGAGCFLVPNLMTIFGPARWPVELLVMLPFSRWARGHYGSPRFGRSASLLRRNSSWLQRS